MIRLSVCSVFVSLTLFAQGVESPLPTEAHRGEKTCFQTFSPWRSEMDVRSDVAIVYGMNDSFEERVRGWRQRGYGIHFMTGIAWGHYQDYFTGKFDGALHPEDGQVQRDGSVIWHGKDVPYVVPSASYLVYIKSLVKRAIDGGVTAIHLEEPEFWNRAGYSESFKREWQQFYGFPWVAPHESPEATYLSAKLKYQLYFNALKEVFLYARSYSESRGTRVACYVPTHSLLNYAAWQITSPEASLAALPGMDGYIAQVWTGTSREPVYYDGVEKERVFENAFLEYGTMISMTAPTGRKIFFLTDPVEDRPRTWDDYKRNYQATYTAQLMYPMVDNYEVMPWPSRIYLGKFKLENNDTPQPISAEYATQMQVMVNVLNGMPRTSNRINGNQGIGVLLANSMMFQRFPIHQGYEDPRLSNFYGMVIPLLKHGIPVETVHMENLGLAGTLRSIRVLIMSYANMKPLSPEVHRHLAEWVNQGGILIYYGRDEDPFQKVQEWWNSHGNRYDAPSQHLFEQLKLSEPSEGIRHACGKGAVYIVREDPKELVLESGGHANFMELVKKAYEQDAHSGVLQQKNHFYLQRGAYDIAAVMDESGDASTLVIKGPAIDLFDPALPVVAEKTVHPGEQAVFLNLNRIENKLQAQVLCAASRVYEEKRTDRSYSFIAKSPSGTRNVMRLLLPAAPGRLSVADHNGQAVQFMSEWDAGTRTCLLQYENDCSGLKVVIGW